MNDQGRTGSVLETCLQLLNVESKFEIGFSLGSIVMSEIDFSGVVRSMGAGVSTRRLLVMVNTCLVTWEMI